MKAVRPAFMESFQWKRFTLNHFESLFEFLSPVYHKLFMQVNPLKFRIIDIQDVYHFYNLEDGWTHFLA